MQQTTTSRDSAPQEVADSLADFSIVRTGLVWRLAKGLSGHGNGLWRAGCLAALVAWLPLLVLTAFEHLLMGGAEIPFSGSIGTHVRLLVAVPLMFVAETWFDRRTRAEIGELGHSGVVRQEQFSYLSQVLRRGARLVGAWPAESTLAILTIVLVSSGARVDDMPMVSTWRTSPDGGTTLAGGWYDFVSIPLFQFLFWRWCWRLLVWGWLLWRFSRFDLDLVPAHPDLAGGLAGLGLTQVSLTPLVFAVSAVLVASFAEGVMFGGNRLDGLALPLTATVIAAVVLLFAPLLLFSPRLLAAKDRGLATYGRLGGAYAKAFESKWVARVTNSDELLGSADIQSLADLASSFEIVRNMRTVPLAWHDVLLVALAAAIPMTPLLLLAFPLDELIVRGLQTVIGF